MLLIEALRNYNRLLTKTSRDGINWRVSFRQDGSEGALRLLIERLPITVYGEARFYQIRLGTHAALNRDGMLLLRVFRLGRLIFRFDRLLDSGYHLRFVAMHPGNPVHLRPGASKESPCRKLSGSPQRLARSCQ